jgi:hypothetical protein
MKLIKSEDVNIKTYKKRSKLAMSVLDGKRHIERDVVS